MDSLQRRVTSDNYGRKLKPTAKKTGKTRQKTKKTLKKPAALLALGMLAIMSGLIAGTALTKSVNQVPNVVTQATFAYCGYMSLTGASSFGGRLWETLRPAGFGIGLYGSSNLATVGAGHLVARIGARWGWQDVIDIARDIVLQGSRFLRFTPKFGAIVLA